MVVRRETPPPADNFFDALNNVDWEHYVYVKCLVCHGVYRYGIYGFQEGAINCVYCGTLTWNPILVTKDEYRAFLEKRQNPQGMDKFVRSVWGQILTEKGTDEEYQRR